MNSITQFKEGFEARYQDIINKVLIGKVIASFGMESNLKWGKKVHRPKFNVSGLMVRDVTRYVDRTMNAISDSDQYLEIDRQKAVDFSIDDWDKLQTGPLQLGETAGEQAAIKLRTYIDADILAEVVNGKAVFDSGNIGGSAGTPITPVTGTSSNIGLIFSTLMATLQANNIQDSGMAIVIDPFTAALISQEIFGKNINMTDTVLKNGYSGPILGFETYLSNNLPFTASLHVATNPSEGDTVTIAGVVFTFNATPSGAGSVDIGANAAGSVANLVLAINGGAVGSTYIALSATDRATLTNYRLAAVDGTTNITFTATGAGRGVTTAETLTNASDIWSKRVVHVFAGKKGSIDVVMQQDVEPTFRDEPKQKTTNVLTDALYGIKTFDDGKEKFLDLQIAV